MFALGLFRAREFFTFPDDIAFVMVDRFGPLERIWVKGIVKLLCLFPAGPVVNPLLNHVVLLSACDEHPLNTGSVTLLPVQLGSGRRYCRGINR